MINSAVYPTLKQVVLAQWRLRQDWQIAGGLGLLTLLFRLPFVGQTLYHWDSINFALSLQHFDVAKGSRTYRDTFSMCSWHSWLMHWSTMPNSP
ncbi:MAG: hypothetical protein HC875_30460 [Anaerolineales bacterium]|nr:hypothetical protein [Anaerolineales bacterium]